MCESTSSFVLLNSTNDVGGRASLLAFLLLLNRQEEIGFESSMLRWHFVGQRRYIWNDCYTWWESAKSTCRVKILAIKMLFQGFNYVCLQISKQQLHDEKFVFCCWHVNAWHMNACVCYLLILHFSLFKPLITAVVWLSILVLVNMYRILLSVAVTLAVRSLNYNICSLWHFVDIHITIYIHMEICVCARL